MTIPPIPPIRIQYDQNFNLKNKALPPISDKSNHPSKTGDHLLEHRKPLTCLPPINNRFSIFEINNDYNDNFLRLNKKNIEAYTQKRYTLELEEEILDFIFCIEGMSKVKINNPEQLEFLELFSSIQRLEIINKNQCFDDSKLKFSEIISSIPRSVEHLKLVQFAPLSREYLEYLSQHFKTIEITT